MNIAESQKDHCIECCLSGDNYFVNGDDGVECLCPFCSGYYSDYYNENECDEGPQTVFQLD